MSETQKGPRAKAPGKPAADQVTVEILGPVNHDGQRYDAGDELTLDAKAAEALLAAGIVKPLA